MSLEAPINAGHMVPNSMEIFIAKRRKDALLQAGYYKNPNMEPAGESSEDVYANWTLKKIKDWNKFKITFDLHELTNEKVEILQLWLQEKKPWTVTNEVETFMPWTRSFEDDILLKYSNQDGSAVNVSKIEALIDGTLEELVANTDYVVVATTLWATAIELKTGSKLTENAYKTVKLVVTYSSTADDVTIIEHKANGLAKGFVMVLVNEFEYDGKKKSIKTYLDNCQANKSALKQINDNDGTTAGMPIEVTWWVVKQETIWFNS